MKNRKIIEGSMSLLLLMVVSGCASVLNVPDTPSAECVRRSIGVAISNIGMLDYRDPPRLEGEGKYVICDVVETFGGEHFLHGVSIINHDDILYASYAYNAVKENSHGERCFWQKSLDGGRTWSSPNEIKANMLGRSASHGVFMEHDGKLYYLLPAVDFISGAWQIICELHLFDEKTQDWTFICNIGRNFWPNTEPKQLSNGNWIASGGNCGIIVSNGNDIESEWNDVKVKLSLKCGETSCAVNGDNVFLFSRPKVVTLTTGELGDDTERYQILFSKSLDGGNTFSSPEYTSIVASPSRTYSGFLSDGRMYLLFNQDWDRTHGRNRLLMAVSDENCFNLDHLYVVDEYTRPISYPYAIEKDGKLYIAYSQGVGTGNNVNHNDIVMKVISSSEIR